MAGDARQGRRRLRVAVGVVGFLVVALLGGGMVAPQSVPRLAFLPKPAGRAWWDDCDGRPLNRHEERWTRHGPIWQREVFSTLVGCISNSRPLPSTRLVVSSDHPRRGDPLVVRLASEGGQQPDQISSGEYVVLERETGGRWTRLGDLAASGGWLPAGGQAPRHSIGIPFGQALRLRVPTSIAPGAYRLSLTVQYRWGAGSEPLPPMREQTFVRTITVRA